MAFTAEPKLYAALGKVYERLRIPQPDFVIGAVEDRLKREGLLSA